MPASRTYDVVLTWLETGLRTGQLRVGQRLPSERSLAERFGISRGSVREAIRVLDAMGLVRSGVGSGPNAGAVVISEPSAALGWGLRMHLASRSLPVPDVVATRITLESGAAAEAARAVGADRDARGVGAPSVVGIAPGVEAAHAGEVGETTAGTAGQGRPYRAADLLEEAADLLAELDDPGLPDERFHAQDAAFHLLISSLGGNVVVTTILDSLRQATVGYVQEGVLRLADWPQVRRRLQVQHRRILAAVVQARPEEAAAAVAEHISWFHTTAWPTPA